MGYCIKCGQVCTAGESYCTACGRKKSYVPGGQKRPHTGILFKGMLLLLPLCLAIAAYAFRSVTDDRSALTGTWVCTDRAYLADRGGEVTLEFREDGICLEYSQAEPGHNRFQYSLLSGSGIKAVRFVIADGEDAGQSYICRYRLDNHRLELRLDGFVRFERK